MTKYKYEHAIDYDIFANYDIAYCDTYADYDLPILTIV